MKVMIQFVDYCYVNPDRGWTINPKRHWDGKKGGIKFVVGGQSDSD